MKKEIFTKEEIKEMEQMQERAKAKRLLQADDRQARKQLVKKMVIKQSIKKGIISLASNMVGIYGIMKACYTNDMIMLLGVIWFILFINMILTINK